MSQFCYIRGKSSGSLDEFLDNNRPSTITSAESHWLWYVRNEVETPIEQEAIEIGERILETALEAIQDTTSTVNKKQIREDARKELEFIAKAYNFTCGKWMLFQPRSTVDDTFKRLVISLDHGGLSQTPCHTLKVSTASSSPNNSSHVFCLYIDNIFDYNAAYDVLKTMTTEVQVTPSAAKPDLYTMIGLYARHPSGLSPSIWTPKNFGIDTRKENMEELVQG